MLCRIDNIIWIGGRARIYNPSHVIYIRTYIYGWCWSTYGHNFEISLSIWFGSPTYVCPMYMHMHNIIINFIHIGDSRLAHQPVSHMRNTYCKHCNNARNMYSVAWQCRRRLPTDFRDILEHNLHTHTQSVSPMTSWANMHCIFGGQNTMQIEPEHATQMRVCLADQVEMRMRCEPL